jgi:putative aldouronate transport system permease protein
MAGLGKAAAGIVTGNVHPRRLLLKRILIRYDLYLLLLVPMIYYAVFKYYPMYGLQIAFKDFSAAKGITGSEWVGFKHVLRFFSSYYFKDLLWNTVSLSLYSLLVGFPIPILLALLINEIKGRRMKKWVQNATYIPHFLSLVVIVGMLNIFLDAKIGVVNRILVMAGANPIDFMLKAEWFQTIFVGSSVWQSMGWGSIIYLAALSSIDPTLYEAAKIDGASRLRRIWHVSLPGIMPTIIILFILQIGHLMDVGFEKVLLMQNPINAQKAEIISTFVYKNGIQQGQYSYTAAAGLFNSVIDFTLLLIVNTYARRKSDTSLW